MFRYRSLMAGLLLLVLDAKAYAGSHAGSITATETDLAVTETRSVEAEATRWGLTIEEYRRYQHAMEGLRGRLSVPNITPIEVLGIEAKTSAERDRYAEMWVEMIRADTTKTLAFTRAVHDAWQRLYPDESLIDRRYINETRARHGSKWGPIPLEGPSETIGGRLLVFTEIACAICNADVLDLIRQVEAGTHAGLDIYVMDVAIGDAVAIQHWAEALPIPTHLVQHGTLTLNFDAGALQTLTDSMQFTPASLPIVMRRRGQSYDLVSWR